METKGLQIIRIFVVVSLQFLIMNGNAQEVAYCESEFQFYPKTYKELPNVSSPCILKDGTEIIIARTKDDEYAIVPVTVENGEQRNYIKRQWGKGNQFEVDSVDFPTLAKTGLHSKKELKKTKTIGGKPVDQITIDGRPGNFSSGGFMGESEDIISVLKSDNSIVKQLGLTHPQLAKPLFNIFNLMLEHRTVYLAKGNPFEDIDFVFYNGNKIFLKWGGAKGWQNSIFNDNNLGYYWIKIWRELTDEETVFLKENYSQLSEEQFDVLKKNLSEINTGEMIPYYISRYGFYEGQTTWRADPVTISFVFGLKTLSEIERLLNNNLYSLLVLKAKK